MKDGPELVYKQLLVRIEKLRITNQEVSIDSESQCFLMLQFGKDNFASTTQILKEFDETIVDTEFTLNINPENVTKLLSINLHQVKKENRKRSKVVGRIIKMALPKLAE